MLSRVTALEPHSMGVQKIIPFGRVNDYEARAAALPFFPCITLHMIRGETHKQRVKVRDFGDGEEIERFLKSSSSWWTKGRRRREIGGKFLWWIVDDNHHIKLSRRNSMHYKAC